VRRSFAISTRTALPPTTAPTTPHSRSQTTNNGAIAIANGDHHSNVGVTTAYNAGGNTTGLGYVPMPGTVDAHSCGEIGAAAISTSDNTRSRD
jgi:hypothetical protein